MVHKALNMYDVVVVGGGIGGTCAAAMLSSKGKKVLLLEKEPYLGGCSSTFSHQGFRYNTGATTFAGFEEGMPVHRFFESLHVTLPLLPLSSAYVQIQKGKALPRFEDLEAFLEALERVHPHPQNRAFWEEIWRINRAFYAHQDYVFSKRSWGDFARSLVSFLPIARAFFPLLLRRGDGYIRAKLPGISSAYKATLDASLRIVTQTTTHEASALSTVLALGYPFLRNVYVQGGMGALFDALEPCITHVRKKTPVSRIFARSYGFEIHARHEVFHARTLVLNTPVFESARFFEPSPIQEYFARFKPLDNDQSAFMVYATFCTDAPLEHHYQILLDVPLPHTTSEALFASFSDASDHHLAPQGHRSMTLSVHTKSSWWKGLPPALYKTQKAALVSQILDQVCATLGLEKSSVVHHFGATPKTFARYLGRAQLGGIPMSYTRPFFLNPANDTPFCGLYMVGDTTFAAQGWPGVIAGVNNLQKLLDA